MEQTNMNKQQSRLTRFQAKLDGYGTQSNELRVRLNKRQKRYNKLQEQLNKLHAQCDTCCKMLWDIRENIKKVKENMELALSRNEHIDTIWKLCDELRELEYKEYEGCKKLYKNECKYYDCDEENSKYYDKVDDLECEIKMCEHHVDNLIEFASEYGPELVETLIEYGSKYGFNLSK
jgi:chromosome segregation ATPase